MEKLLRGGGFCRLDSFAQREACSGEPQLAEYPNYFHTLAVDVPFRERYLPRVYMKTGEGTREKVIPACLRWNVPRTCWAPGAEPTVC